MPEKKEQDIDFDLASASWEDQKPGVLVRLMYFFTAILIVLIPSCAYTVAYERRVVVAFF